MPKSSFEAHLCQNSEFVSVRFRTLLRFTAILIYLSILPAASMAADSVTPQLNLDAINDPAAAKALREGTDLPVMARPEGSGLKSEFRDTGVAVEKERLAGILKLLGYLDAKVIVSGDQFVPLPGLIYRIGLVTVGGLEDGSLTAAERSDLATVISSAIGKAARGDVIDELEKTILWKVNSAGFAFAKVAQRRLLTGSWPELATVDFEITPGTRAFFGPVTFNGNYRTRTDDLVRYIPFRQGAPFDPAVVSLFEERLMDTGLFWTVHADYADTPDAEGRLAIRVKVREKTMSSKLLAQTGRVGLTTSVAVLGLMGLAQVASAAGAPILMRRSLLSLSLIGFAVCMVMAFQRVLMLLGVQL